MHAINDSVSEYIKQKPTDFKGVKIHKYCRKFKHFPFNNSLNNNWLKIGKKSVRIYKIWIL